MKRTFAVAMLVGLTVPVTVRSQQGAVAPALAALKAKRQASGVETYHFSVEQTIDGTVFSPNGKVIKSGSTKEITFEWPSGKFRLQDLNTAEDGYDLLKVFDGTKSHTKFKHLDAKGKPQGEWKYGLITGDNSDRRFGVEFWPIFYNRGTIPHATTQGFYPGQVLFDSPDERFFLHRKAGDSLLIRSFADPTPHQKYSQYTLDPTKNHAITEVTQFTATGQKEFTVVIDMKQWEGTWAPAGWQVSEYFDGKLAQSTKATVLKYSKAAKPPVGLLELVFPEGVKVGQSDARRTPDGKSIDVHQSKYEVRMGKLVPIDP